MNWSEEERQWWPHHHFINRPTRGPPSPFGRERYPLQCPQHEALLPEIYPSKVYHLSCSSDVPKRNTLTLNPSTLGKLSPFHLTPSDRPLRGYHFTAPPTLLRRASRLLSCQHGEQPSPFSRSLRSSQHTTPIPLSLLSKPSGPHNGISSS